MTSESPDGINVIKVVEKGETALFFPSTVRVKYRDKYIERIVKNDGKNLDDSNVTISWKNDAEATITLYGEEQNPDVIKFNAEDSIPLELGEFDKKQTNAEEFIPFKIVHDGQSSFTFKTSDSPGLVNIIEFREVIPSIESGLSATVHIYYGKRGSVLEKYIEYIPSDMYAPDNFKIEWKNDEQVKIDVMRENEKGEIYIEESIEIDSNE
ncbi:hypothetical protein [Lysinibacillus sp. NPDC059133]|uniref:hypothetical protein n=1 Tax=Lysinibacillus sp. NPDC059133 TaxID=3346737 RepID=UPI0036B2E4A3